MGYHSIRSLTLLLVLVLFTYIASSFVRAVIQVPMEGLGLAESPIKGWRWWGGWPAGYEYEISDDVFYKGKKSVYIHSITDNPQDFPFPRIGLSQTFKADKYRNKRMGFSAAIKAESTGSAALYMSINGPCHELLCYDDMYGRNVTGITDWKELNIVLEVPEESTYIEFGITVSGKGQFWASAVTFEETEDEPTGNGLYPDEPNNLDFSE